MEPAQTTGSEIEFHCLLKILQSKDLCLYTSCSIGLHIITHTDLLWKVKGTAILHQHCESKSG